MPKAKKASFQSLTSNRSVSMNEGVKISNCALNESMNEGMNGWMKE